MHSAYLLVIDNSPDHAQVINSFLRNSGVAVRVVSASNMDELEIVLKEKTPFLILLSRQMPASMKISQVLLTADHHSTPVVMQIRPEDSANIEAAIATHPLLVINADEVEQLMQVVKQHMSGG
jgi:CheY-like chemotaxis protein